MSARLRLALFGLFLLAAAPAWPARAAQPAEACKAGCLGLPREDRSRIAACFARCNAASTPRMSGNGFGLRAAPVALPQATAAWGAIYAAPPPSAGLGVVAGRGDRLATHGRAEAAYASRAGGLPCRMLVEFTSGCAATAQASLGPRIAATTAETGPTRQAAETAALGACRARSPEGCRVVQAACLD